MAEERVTHEHKKSSGRRPAARKSGRSAAAPGKKTAPTIHYTVAMPHPASHTFHVGVVVSGAKDDVTLAFPAWTPGSYKVRDFAKNVSGFRARQTSAGDGKGVIEHELLDKQRYRVPTKDGGFTATFTVYADEFSVRTPHLDDIHGFFLGTNLLPYIEGEPGRPAKARHEVTILPPQGWNVATGLLPVAGKANTYGTDDYDELGDSIFEIGTHEMTSFLAHGAPHNVAFAGWGNFDKAQVTADLAKIVTTEGKLFGGVPYRNYLFVIHALPDAGGGLEHLNSCVCGWSSFDFKARDKYDNFLRLCAHEFFHVWNVKRIRPAVLGPFNYSGEQYTRALWVMEGLTTYYERLWCTRAGISSEESLLSSYAELFEREDNRPGRRVMSLEESSWLAWTKLYQADENFVNTGISYYARGAQVGFLLDAKIRAATNGIKSLDDVMKLAFERHGWPKPGFKERGFEAMCEEVAGVSFEDFWRDHVRGTEEVDYRDALEVYGLELKRDGDRREPWIGANLAMKDGAFQVRGVESGSPAMRAGLQVRDEVIALNGLKVGEKDFKDRLGEVVSGEPVRITLFRRGRLIDAQVMPVSRPSGKLRLSRVAKPSPQQKLNYDKWLWKERS
ncbi:MAG: M61 family metallopeptidase [Planctomycetes bacterium]|nr:M61 family metallopeptidase [Planctomycetota bacterium]